MIAAASSRFYQQPDGWDDRWACRGSGIYDPRDRDSDGDGIADAYDAFPEDGSERYDTDLDGIGNNRDTDDDNDGVADGDDAFPLDVNETVDSDGDGVGNNSDVFPDDDSEWADSDGDGIGDNADVDADGNGYADCPVGTTEVEGNLCLIPSQVRTDLTLTYRASVDIQQPDYLMDSRVEVGELGYIGSAEDLFRVLDNSATLTLEPGVHVRATSEGRLSIARGSKIHAEGTPRTSDYVQ